MLCGTCYFPLFQSSVFLWQPLTNLSRISATECLPISSSCLQRDLQGCLPNTNLPIAFPERLCLMVTAFPCSNARWLHSKFLQDTRAQALQTTGWGTVVHQQHWQGDKPDSTGRHARSRGQEVDCYHIRDFCGFRSLSQPTKRRYSQLSLSQAQSCECADSHPPDPSRRLQFGTDSARSRRIPAAATHIGG